MRPITIGPSTRFEARYLLVERVTLLSPERARLSLEARRIVTTCLEHGRVGRPHGQDDDR
jgi:hypothetical protein